MGIFERWLIVKVGNEITITPRMVTWHAPINRVLDGAGRYIIDAVEVGKIVYIITYDPNETIGSLTKLLVTKFIKSRKGDEMTHLDESDMKNIDLITTKFMLKETSSRKTH